MGVNFKVAAKLSQLRFLVFQGMAGKAPRVNNETGHWETYDNDVQDWADTGTKAKGDPGPSGISPTVTTEPITGGNRVTITDAEHPTGQSFDVMDGRDGGGLNKQQFDSIITLFRAAIFDTSVLPDPSSVIDALEDSYDSVPATGISLSASSLSFDDNTPKSVSVTLSPSNTTDGISAASSNSAVANVSVSGLVVTVTPIANGSATITITTDSGVFATVSVTVAMPVQRTVTNNLVGCSTSNEQQTASEGRPYTAVLTPTDSSYNFTSVEITMGGVDITQSAWDASTGEISIASVSGDIVITATAVSSVLYTLPTPFITSGDKENYINTRLILGESNVPFTLVCYIKHDRAIKDVGANMTLFSVFNISDMDQFQLFASTKAYGTSVMSNPTGGGWMPHDYTAKQHIKLVYRYDPNTLTLYETLKYFEKDVETAQDKVYEDTYTYSSFKAATKPLEIGRRTDGYGPCNHMTFESFKVLNYILSDEEVAAYIATEEAEV